MRKLLYALLILVAGCGDHFTTEDLPLMNGYWEIDTVLFPDGNKKDYPSSTTIDYFELKDNKGFRKKMEPHLDGTFATSNDAIAFDMIDSKEGFFIDYHHGDIEWLEELVGLTKNSLSLKNHDGITYIYKRFEPIRLPAP